MEILVQVVSLISAIATLIAACIAIPGLNKWKKQLKGTDEYETAKLLMIQIYKLRDCLNIMRSPVMTYFKLESESEFSARKRYLSNYLLELIAINNDIHSVKASSEFIWGQEVTKKINTILEQVKEYQIALNYFYESEEKLKQIDKRTHHLLFSFNDDKFRSKLYKGIDDLYSVFISRKTIK